MESRLLQVQMAVEPASLSALPGTVPVSPPPPCNVCLPLLGDLRRKGSEV